MQHNYATTSFASIQATKKISLFIGMLSCLALAVNL